MLEIIWYTLWDNLQFRKSLIKFRRHCGHSRKFSGNLEVRNSFGFWHWGCHCNLGCCDEVNFSTSSLSESSCISFRILYFSRWSIMWLHSICSSNLQFFELRDTSLWFYSFDLSLFLNKVAIFKNFLNNWVLLFVLTTIIWILVIFGARVFKDFIGPSCFHSLVRKFRTSALLT